MNEVGPNIAAAVLEKAEGMVAEGRSTEEVLAFLKRSGANAIASIRALQRLFNISVPEAQEMLHKSESWREMRE